MKGIGIMKRRSLKAKSIIAMLLIAILLSATAILISYSIYCNTMDEHYKTNAMNIAKAAASQMNGDKIREYVTKVETLDSSDKNYEESVQAIKDDEYYDMLNILFELKESHDALYLYVQKVAAEGAVYIIDADYEETACELGETFPLADVNFQYLDSLDKGLPAFITDDDEYGWLCSAGAPIFDSNGEVVSLAFVDISMDEVMADRHGFLLIICMALIIAAAAAATIIILLINKFVVSPINLLSTAASKFVSEKDESGDSVESAISRLEIHTGDEIENLSEAIKTMEMDINNYIKNLTAITAEKERIGAELNVATQIQTSMLPRIFPIFPDRVDFDIYATMQPAKEVGGDFYDIFLTDDNHLAVVMADVSGKGVPAALFMVVAKILIKSHAQSGMSPAEVFTEVNAKLCENNDAGMFVTAWMGILDITSGKLTYANAGHNPPYLKRAGEAFEILKPPAGFILAGMEGIRYRQSELTLEPGDVLYLYTDGVTEATDNSNNMYGEDRLLAALNDNRDAEPADLLPAIKEDLDKFVDLAPQFDDITMLALKYKGKVLKRLTVPAKDEELKKVQDFIEAGIKAADFSARARVQIRTAVEEIFINIAHYAYDAEGGDAEVWLNMDKNVGAVEITFIDSGRPYNPLEKPDPDITLPADDRAIGGLGIYMVKKTMDNIYYKYEDNKNKLTIVKNKL